MTSILVKLSLLLVGVTICLAEGTSGEDIGKVFVAPINKAINKFGEDGIKLNVVKREATPEAKAGKNKNNKKYSPKKRKQKNSKRIEKEKKKKNIGNKNKTLKKRKRKIKKQRRKNGEKKKNRVNKNKQPKRRKRRKKQASKNGKKKHNNRNKNKRKKKNRKKKKRKNKQGSKNGKKKNNAEKEKHSRRKGKCKTRRARPAACNSDCAAVADSIRTYRLFLNKQRQIIRTTKMLGQLEGKGTLTRRNKFKQDAEWLEKVTNNGTGCPGNSTPGNTVLVIETVAGLKECASDTGPIARFCTKSVITDVTILEEAEAICLQEAAPSPPYTSYGTVLPNEPKTGWIGGFTECFETTRTCACFVAMNGPNDGVPNDSPYSCRFPNRDQAGYIKGWILKFQADTNAALNKCKQRVQACKALERQGCYLTSICCKNASDGGTDTTTSNSGNMTTAASGRKMKIKASMLKQLKKINIH